MMEMNCNEVTPLTGRFLNDELDNTELEAFLHHLDGCKDCTEELTIQLLVKVGMERLETGGDFNLNKELKGQLTQARRRLKLRSMLQGVSFTLQALVLAGVLAVIILSGIIL